MKAHKTQLITQSAQAILSSRGLSSSGTLVVGPAHSGLPRQLNVAIRCSWQDDNRLGKRRARVDD